MTAVRTRALPATVHAANEALAFLLELAMPAGLAWWGASRDASLSSRVLLAVAAPLAAAVVWGLFAAPRARIRIPAAGVLVIKAVVFVVTAVAVYSAGLHPVAIAGGVIAFLNAGIAAVDREAIGGGGRTRPGPWSPADVVDDRDHLGEGGAEHPEPGQRDQPVR
jgi:Protein of unknown function (DUF2568)